MLNNCTVNFIKLGATFPRKLFLSGAGLEFAQDLEQEARNKSNIVPKNGSDGFISSCTVCV